jgi:hypothetical protein
VQYKTSHGESESKVEKAGSTKCIFLSWNRDPGIHCISLTSRATRLKPTVFAPQSKRVRDMQDRARRQAQAFTVDSE